MAKETINFVLLNEKELNFIIKRQESVYLQDYDKTDPSHP